MLITLTGIVFLSTLIEGLLTYLFGEKDENATPRKYLRYVSLALGIVLAFAYDVRIPQMLGIVATNPFIDYFISGIIIGRGSNYVNDLFSHFRGKE